MSVKDGMDASSETETAYEIKPEKRCPDDSLILCSDCQRHYYRSEPNCPFCGVSISKNVDLKIAAINQPESKLSPAREARTREMQGEAGVLRGDGREGLAPL